MEQMRLRHDVECGTIIPAGTIVSVIARCFDNNPEYCYVKTPKGQSFPIHWDELDPVDEPYGDTQ